MRIDKVSTEVYPFNELSDEAKQTALEQLYDINVDYEWWDYMYGDAENVGIKLESFDLDQHRHCTGQFIGSPEEVAEKILKEHGENCETYKSARDYLDERSALVKKYSDGIAIDVVHEDNEYDFDNDCDDLDNDFQKSIFEDYSILFQKEYEYLMSEESIIETIKCNDYEFTAEGKLY